MSSLSFVYHVQIDMRITLASSLQLLLLRSFCSFFFLGSFCSFCSSPASAASFSSAASAASSSSTAASVASTPPAASSASPRQQQLLQLLLLQLSKPLQQQPAACSCICRIHHACLRVVAFSFGTPSRSLYFHGIFIVNLVHPCRTLRPQPSSEILDCESCHSSRLRQDVWTPRRHREQSH